MFKIKSLKMLFVMLIGLLIIFSSMSLAMEYNESPSLKKLVDEGQLPAVQERLPEDPLIIEPIETIGKYGGNLRSLTTSESSAGEGSWFLSCGPMLSLTPDGSEVIPNIARSWEYSNNKKTFTLHLRKGIKWSDGELFTVDDILFQFEDVYGNDELSPVKPIQWTPGGELVETEKIDDYTIKFHFASPYPVVHQVLSHSAGMQGGFFRPKHYLKQFHPKYTSLEKLEEIVEEEGFPNWTGLFNNRAAAFTGIQVQGEAPVLAPYILEERTTSYLKYKRNPYYWKVDSAGNQLPYIDKVTLNVISDTEVATGKIISGDVDYAVQYTDIQNYGLYKANEEKGSYRTLEWESLYMADAGFELNRTTEDPILRELFQDKRFSQAVSSAINREEINNMIYFGLAKPLQATVHPNSSFYEEEYAKSYVEYDLDRANKLLDDLGLEWDENHEYRLRSDGERLSILLEFVDTETPKTAICELVKEQLSQVGIELRLKEVSWDLERRHIKADQSEMGLWHVSPVIDATWYSHMPFWCVIVESETRYSSAWGRYIMSGGEVGEEPSQEMMRAQENWDVMKTVADDEKRISLGKEILEIQAENLWTIGTVGMAPVPIIAADNLRNVPEDSYWGWDVMFGLYSRPDQYFLK